MKIIKIIIINLFLFLLLFHVADFYASLKFYGLTWFYERHKGNKLVTYIKHYAELHDFSVCYSKHLNNTYNDLTSEYYDKRGEDSLWSNFRPIENNDAQNSIILFGCSYAYGYHLSDNETFSAHLGKALPNYKIYNRAKDGWTTSHMLYQLENKNFSEYKNVKYVVYVFMLDHVARNTDSYLVEFTPYYKQEVNNNLKFQKFSVKYSASPLISLGKAYLKHLYINKVFPKYLYGKTENLTKREIELSKLNAENLFPDAKFVILRYTDDNMGHCSKMFDELKKEGFIVVSLSDLSDKNYFSPEYMSKADTHPNAKAWAEITPLFVKYLQDRGYLKD